MSDKIKVLVVEPMRPCKVQEISSLNDMQTIVGGHIQAVYPFRDEVALVCNEDGKRLGLPYNRPLTNDRGIPYDMVCGTFFLAGLGVEDFVSLTEEQIQRYKSLYDNMAVLTAERPTPQYDLSSAVSIFVSAGLARERAAQEPDQSSYNAAWLHGYAKALTDAAEQMGPPQHLKGGKEKTAEQKKKRGEHCER